MSAVNVFYADPFNKEAQQQMSFSDFLHFKKGHNEAFVVKYMEDWNGVLVELRDPLTIEENSQDRAMIEEAMQDFFERGIYIERGVNVDTLIVYAPFSRSFYPLENELCCIHHSFPSGVMVFTGDRIPGCKASDFNSDTEIKDIVERLYEYFAEEELQYKV